MDSKQKIHQLRTIIEDTLIPLIDSDYYLLEVPYYDNIGDTLIWQGEIDFLRKLPYKCKGMHSGDSFLYPKIKDTDILIFQGGGNFGDIYSWNQQFRMEVIKHYPNNKAIILPQTIWFNDENKLKESAEFFSSHSNVVICARDKVSYQIFKDNFVNEIHLLPDMAFCIDIARWDIDEMGGRDLLLKRSDSELKSHKYIEDIEKLGTTEVTDWPTMLDEDVWQTKLLELLKGIARRFSSSVLWKMVDIYVRSYYKNFLVKSGILMLRTHNKIYTTRLHTAILSVLLSKNHIEFFDNSYGKNKNFYESWLFDCDNIQLIK